MRLQARYYCRNCDRRPGKRHKGSYIGLVLLGIHKRCTPEFISMVSSWSSLLSSFQEVKEILSEQGIHLNVKTVRSLTYHYAERFKFLQAHGACSFKDDEVLKGRRVIVSCDGGRVRLREKKPGPKTKKKRTRYNGAWREPKLLIIYVVNAEGKLEKTFSPVIDGHIKKPDALFSLMKAYLFALKIKEADQLLFVADGAHWIWNRVAILRNELGLEQDKIHELVDFYHAVEHLGKIAALRKAWSAKERKKWIQKQRRQLLKGKSDQVIAAVKAICRGRNGKAITTERNYFIRNQARINYPKIKNLNLPIGSGAIESAIRRVINLRLKGPCTFWNKENAEKIITLRAYRKSGRWNMLKNTVNKPILPLAA